MILIIVIIIIIFNEIVMCNVCVVIWNDNDNVI